MSQFLEFLRYIGSSICVMTQILWMQFCVHFHYFSHLGHRVVDNERLCAMDSSSQVDTIPCPVGFEPRTARSADQHLIHGTTTAGTDKMKEPCLSSPAGWQLRKLLATYLCEKVAKAICIHQIWSFCPVSHHSDSEEETIYCPHI